ncbi:MoaD/ThiS family protein [Dyadobacter tibetensis]|uniref:MoaD/ThiS family protein n=1 Tax=Dyadobacter tibetensis TaxID=1211851 RepID=UPI000470FE08|nr:MoaD/ThiS family protein [Dyadobacter tibetensis]
MQIQILYFGLLADRIGLSSETMDLTRSLNVSEFRQILLNKYPFLGGEKFKIAINQQLAAEEMDIPLQAEIACLPPFAGG